MEMDEVITITADTFKMSVDRLKSRDRSRDILHARYCLFRVLLDLGYTTTDIGQKINMCRTSVTHAMKRHWVLYDTNLLYQRRLDAIRQIVL